MSAITENLIGAVKKTNPRLKLKKEYTKALVHGGEFTKLHYMGALRKQRRLWCSKDLKKIYWGSAKDTKRGNIKGYASTRDLLSVDENAETRLLCLKFTKKKLELKASSLEELDKWVKLFTWLLKNAKRVGFNSRDSVMKRRSWAITTLPTGAEAIYSTMIRLLKGNEATVYIKNEEPKKIYLWMSFLLNEICYGSDVSSRSKLMPRLQFTSTSKFITNSPFRRDEEIDKRSNSQRHSGLHCWSESIFMR